uniref:ORF123 n=1 Tax=Malaco herpesvirus 1 TaxID=3031797 RepID=A0AA48SIT5_9VIRU|nr:TPA_asm: ORF123 [Malaco herpesvirus 1]
MNNTDTNNMAGTMKIANEDGDCMGFSNAIGSTTPKKIIYIETRQPINSKDDNSSGYDTHERFIRVNSGQTIQMPVRGEYQLNSSSLSFKLRDEPDMSKVNQFIERYNVKEFHITRFGMFFKRVGSKFRCKAGPAGICKELGVKESDFRRPATTLIKEIMKDLFKNDTDKEDVLKTTYGINFITGLFSNPATENNKTLKLNLYLQEVADGKRTVEELFNTGLVSELSRNNIQQILERKEEEKKLKKRDDMKRYNGDITVKFARYVRQNGSPYATRDTNLPEIEYTFHGYAQQDHPPKQKHDWIWSKEPNWGKSHVIENTILSNYRSERINDVNNAVGIYENADIYWLDEYGEQSKLPFNTLKNLTGGNAQSGSINRKSHGQSCILPQSAQFIITGNVSPAEAYAVYKHGKKYIPRSCLNMLRERFRMKCLDDDTEMELLKWVAPEELTEKEQLDLLKHMYKDVKPLKTCDQVVRKVVEVYNVLKNKKINGITDRVSVDKIELIMRRLFPLDEKVVKVCWTRILEMMNSNEYYTNKYDPLNNEFYLKKYKNDHDIRILTKNVETLFIIGRTVLDNFGDRTGRMLHGLNELCEDNNFLDSLPAYHRNKIQDVFHKQLIIQIRAVLTDKVTKLKREELKKDEEADSQYHQVEIAEAKDIAEFVNVKDEDYDNFSFSNENPIDEEVTETNTTAEPMDTNTITEDETKQEQESISHGSEDDIKPETDGQAHIDLETATVKQPIETETDNTSATTVLLPHPSEPQSSSTNSLKRKRSVEVDEEGLETFESKKLHLDTII